jgi:TPR repeat protein
LRGLAVLAALLALGLAGPPGARADFEAGMRAANLRDYAGALRAWRPLAEAGQARAQYHLGLLYEEGRGVGRDTAEAARWYRAAAVQGHAPAQNALAILIVQGQGTARDPVEAYRWFALAARAGNGFAGRNLARLRAMLSAAEIAEGEARAAAPLDGSE